MRYLFAAMLCAACADDLATRDYTIAECPAPFAQSVTAYSPEVCDRGAGQSPRFATVEACIAELGLTIPAGSWSYGSTHPQLARCAMETRSSLVTPADLRAGIDAASR